MSEIQDIRERMGMKVTGVSSAGQQSMLYGFGGEILDGLSRVVKPCLNLGVVGRNDDTRDGFCG